MDFPHIKDNDFPNVQNVNAWKYQNDFDYDAYDQTQMEITVCQVPWDVGLVHVGDAQIPGLGNVVRFASEEERNAWFKAIPGNKCYRAATRYNRLHSELEIKLPIPYDVCATYNYVYVHHNTLPVELEGTGIRDWFYFIREVTMLAPNTCRCTLLLDSWQTFIYKSPISAVMLKRGHYPLAHTSVSGFLADGTGASLLTTPDIEPTCEPMRIASQHAEALNADTMACLAGTVDFWGDCGTKPSTWHAPISPVGKQDGLPSMFYMAIEPEKLNGVLTYMQEERPFMFEGIKALFFMPKTLLTLTQSQWYMYQAYTVAVKNTSVTMQVLADTAFGYPENYKGLAKLYTYPYAVYRIGTGDNMIEVRPQDLAIDELSFSLYTQLVYPAISIAAEVQGIGGKSGARLTYSAFESKTYTYNGRSYDMRFTLDVPMFQVYFDAKDKYLNDNYYINPQKEENASKNYDVNMKMAKAIYDNALDSADTAYNTANSTAFANQHNRMLQAETESGNMSDSAFTEGNIQKNISNANFNAKNSISWADKANAENEAQVVNANAELTASCIETVANYDIIAASDDNVKVQSGNTQSTNIANDAMLSLTKNELDLNEANTTVSMVESVAQIFNQVINFDPVDAIGTAIGCIGSTCQAVNAAKATSTEAEIIYSQNQTSNILANTLAQDRNGIATTLERDTSNTTAAKTRATAANDANGITTRAYNTYDAETSGNTAIHNAEQENATAYTNTEQTNANRVLQNGYSEANNSYDAEKSNATARRDTAKTNAKRIYDATEANAGTAKDIVTANIEAETAQAGLMQPIACGENLNIRDAGTKPLMLASEVCTLPTGEVERIGDEWLRYGYYCDKYVYTPDFTEYGKFTYWKCDEVIFKGLAVPDLYADSIRFLLMGGVTVWRRPEDIGNVSIYENKGA